MAFKLLLDYQDADHEGRQRHHDVTLEALPKAAENILLGPHGAHLRRAGKGLRAVQGAPAPSLSSPATCCASSSSPDPDMDPCSAPPPLLSASHAFQPAGPPGTE